MLAFGELTSDNELRLPQQIMVTTQSIVSYAHELHFNGGESLM